MVEQSHSPPDGVVTADRSERAVAADQKATAASLTPPMGRRNPHLPIRGRDLVLKELSGALAGSGPRVHVLHGLSGSGKSAIALELVQRALAAGVTTWWAKADDEPSLVEHMRALLRRVGVSDVEMLSGHPADHLWLALANVTTRWLLVIDNADDPALLAAGTGPLADGRGWVRPYQGSNGMVLIMSRSSDPSGWGHWCVRHKVDMLDEADAVAVLRDHVGVDDDDPQDARRLVDRLGRLPLALRLAGAYLSQARDTAWPDPAVPSTFRGYLDAVDAGRVALRDPDLVRPGQQFVDRAWDMSLDLLRRREPPLTITLLRLAAHLAPAPMPCPDVLNATCLNLTGLPGTTNQQLGRAAAALRDLGLIDLLSSDGRASLALHPLVRDAAERELPAEPGDLAVLTTLVRRSATVTGVTPDDISSWPAWQSVTPHALHMITMLLRNPGQPAQVVEDACYAANFAARSMHARGLYLAADAELQRIQRLATRDLGERNGETLRALHYQAVVHHARGRYREALDAYEKVYAARHEVFGPDDVETIRSRHYRALVWHELGRHAEAQAEYEAVLADRIRVRGPDDRHTLATRHNLARLKQDTGRLAAAEADYRAILDAQQRTMGPDYRHTLATRHNLALCLHAQNRLAEAQAEYDEVYHVERRLLGDEHPDTLAIRANLAVLAEARGHVAQARRERDSVFEAQCRVLGVDHPETRATRQGLVHRGTRPGPL
ncbi:tetratricopeptide repeat protein [Micromonospora sp. NBC_01412]|uniref:tetratricopeptide repeat protein n=1 Tax=Micromonospora sp. NBC_01412 TaxID=2903590 RepID=UPI003246E7F1